MPNPFPIAIVADGVERLVGEAVFTDPGNVPGGGGFTGWTESGNPADVNSHAGGLDMAGGLLTGLDLNPGDPSDAVSLHTLRLMPGMATLVEIAYPTGGFAIDFQPAISSVGASVATGADPTTPVVCIAKIQDPTNSSVRVICLDPTTGAEVADTTPVLFSVWACQAGLA